MLAFAALGLARDKRGIAVELKGKKRRRRRDLAKEGRERNMRRD